jgi:hypothetical protein
MNPIGYVFFYGTGTGKDEGERKETTDPPPTVTQSNPQPIKNIIQSKMFYVFFVVTCYL